MTGPATRSAAPADELLKRFEQALIRLSPAGGKLGLAVSGGPDSLAMLLLAEAAIPGRIEVATVNHGLRPASAGECAMVARVCAERRIPCEVLEVTVGDGNLQAKAREARYRALARWAERRDLCAVATAHHADDQAETLLMRLNRRSGVAGLAGVREVGTLPGSTIPLIRPLLAFRRAELAEVVAAGGLVPVQDPSNADERYDRVRIRKAVAAADWLDVRALAVSAANLAEAEEALGYAAQQLWIGRVSRSEALGEYRYRPPAPRVLEIRILERIIRTLGQEPRGSDVARLIDQLRSGKGGNLGGVLATVEGSDWVFRPEPQRRAA